jgi:dTMP kinase
MTHRGLFITFEGMDGSGKTTQIRLLAERFRAAGREAIETAEPGGTRIGEQIRDILLDPANRELSPTAEMLLYFSSRAQNVDELIVPALGRGAVVISDRFTDSTMVYQGYGRELGEPAVTALHEIACRGLQPDVTLFLDLDLEEGLARARRRNSEAERSDRMDEQATEFHRRVREAYLSLAARHPQRIRVIRADQPVDAVASDIWKVVAGHV